ncbi:MAG: M20/M25/M40 family metallo-hydrolase [Pirellulales bacterium]
MRNRSGGVRRGCGRITVLLVLVLGVVAARGEDGGASASAARLAADTRYLASDELEGRGVGTAGLEKAAHYLADEFRKAGLRTDIFDGQPFQRFSVPSSVDRGPVERNTLVWLGPSAEGAKAEPRVLKLEDEFQSLALGGTGKVTAPVVFAGYGITAPDQKYDDYAGLDVKGKVVLILRKEPQQDKEDSVFQGKQASPHAPFVRKISNAAEHGAAAVILVNDYFSLAQARTAEERAWQESLDKLVAAQAEYRQKAQPTAAETAAFRQEVGRLAELLQLSGQKLAGDFDTVPGFLEAGQASHAKVIPVFFCKRAALAPLLKAAGLDLTEVERQIDADLQPRSRELSGWSVQGEAEVIHRRADVCNVVGVIDGEGPLANETVVIGAHYDHVGKGGPGSGSLAPPWSTEVHNGADDNASGTATLLEVARYFGGRSEKPKRRLVFIAFTGEERGLLGSAHYVKQPRFPLEQTVAMLNMDMVGRLADNKLIVYGTGTAASFDALIDQLNQQHQFTITKHPEGFGPSDHASFYGKQIPVFHFFTGTHPDYHRPSDDADKLNVDGMQRIARLVIDATTAITDAPQRPEYREIKGSAQIGRSGDRPYFGSIPDFAEGVEGYALMGVAKGSPAQRAGLKGGDVIIKLGDARIGSLDDFDLALRKYKVGDKVPVTVKRGTETVTVTVTLDPPK